VREEEEKKTEEGGVKIDRGQIETRGRKTIPQCGDRSIDKLQVLYG